MQHSALYRKYRPSEFDQVVGQDHVVRVLLGAIEKGDIAHAYLFAGSRGTGKTSVARIFARAIGCSEKDLYEIDAASNRGIDDIRELREAVHVLPFESPYKVYIIDEVHMLTKEAFNALLKTLEEPPKHAVFILATTETEKLPETVLSRCQTFQFKKPSRTLLREVITRTAQEEGRIVEAEAADLIALLADGSYRDSHGVLQKVLSVGDKAITRADVEAVTGAPRGELVNEVLATLNMQDANAALSSVAKAREANADMKLFSNLLLERLRTVLLLRYAKDLRPEFEAEYSEDDLKFLANLAENKESRVNSSMLRTLLEHALYPASSAQPSLSLELAIIEICQK